jgi:hypothetical protein
MVYTLADGTQMTRRKKIVLTGAASGALTDYQLKLVTAYAAAMQSDFDCLRFVKADMQTLIDAWLETKSDGSSADVWAEFPTTPANGVAQDYYMYYGNAGAASDWDGAATFISFFDGDSTGWTEVDPNSHLAFANNRLDVAGLSRNEDAYVHQALSVDDNIVLEWTYYVNAGAHISALGIFAQCGDELDDANNLANGFFTADWTGGTTNARTRIMVNGTGYWGLDVTTITHSTQYWCRSIRSGNTVTSYWYSDSARANLIGSSTKTQAGLPSLSHVSMISTYNSGSAYTWSGWMDDFRVRKYAANPPTAVLGTEEHQRRIPIMM